MKSKQYDNMAGNPMDVKDHPDVNLPSFPYNIWGGSAGVPGIDGTQLPKGTPDLNKKKQIKQPDPGSSYDQGDE